MQLLPTEEERTNNHKVLAPVRMLWEWEEGGRHRKASCQMVVSS